ncbi:methyl-accepting chemotaxis protein [Planctobacterium marinum]|uniref:methyl-accepting chemotaxis protein n=1 Tax=Planctobacterium marinum TaxID=1631968 RepID=UPI001E45F456|nr:methyl-accepting chemotaxis protein [Planctobacterium marinum]MCC2604278.1 methyl-accepting chemotaxis protein [Planctobacterium marinum]
MHWFLNLSIKNKLWLLTGSFFASLSVVIIVAFWTQQKLANDVDIIANKYFTASNLMLAADANLYRAISAERSLIFVSTSSPPFRNLVNYHKQNIEEAQQKLQQFKLVIDDPQIHRLMNDYERLSKEWQTLTFQVVSLRENNGREERREASRISLQDASQKFAEMHDVIDQMSAVVTKDSQMVVQEAESNVTFSASLILFVTIGAVLFGTFMTLMAIRLLAQPLKVLTDRLKQISSGDGDLTQRLEEDRCDEIGETAIAFNKFASNQAAILKQVKNAMVSFMQSMEFVGEKMNHLHHATSKQQEVSDDVAGSMSQMSMAVTDVAKNAANASEATEEANQLAIKGHAVVNESVSTINTITSNIATTSEVVKQLDVRTQSISNVTDTISEIADQTNLLALNAAIEAARAGEQGRGFAVVAEEVRNLAKRTSELTKQIRENIEQLSVESAQAVSVMEESLNNSKILDEKAILSGQALQEITTAVDLISGMNMTVASAVEEQSVTAEEINRSIDNLKSMAVESDAHSQDTLKEVVELLSLARDMQSLLNRFKVE